MEYVIKNIETNKKTIKLIEKAISERCRDLYDQINAIKSLNQKNLNTIKGFVNNKSFNIVERYIIWRDHVEKEKDSWKYHSDIIDDHIDKIRWDWERYVNYSLVGEIEIGIIDEVLYSDTGRNNFEHSVYIKDCTERFNKLSEDDKEYIKDIFEEMIILNIDEFKYDW